MNKIVKKETPLTIAKKIIKINSKQKNTKHIQNKQTKNQKMIRDKKEKEKKLMCYKKLHFDKL
jgi:hypothetical protein